MSYSFNGVMRDLIDLHGWWKEGFDNYDLRVMILLQYWLFLFLKILSIVKDMRRPTLHFHVTCATWGTWDVVRWPNECSISQLQMHNIHYYGLRGLQRSEGNSAGWRFWDQDKKEDLKTAELSYILAVWSVHDTIYRDRIQFCEAGMWGLFFLTDFSGCCINQACWSRKWNIKE